MKSKPWITSAIRKSINIKNNIYKKFLKTNSSYYHSKFKLYRNKLNRLLRISKRIYYNNYFVQNINDTKRLWKGIKQIIHFKSKVKNIIMKIVNGENEINNSVDIANAFNDYFSNIGTTLASKIPRVGVSPMQYLTGYSSDNFFISPITYVEIENEISNLKANKSTGPYSIPVKALKILKALISKPLEIIFNSYILTGTVTTHFKLAYVVPIYTNETLTIISN